MKIKSAFTLIELLISVSIFAVIMVSLYSAFSTGVLGLGKIEESAAVSETGYMILGRIERDLRNSFAYSSDDVKFTGDKSGLTFFTLSPLFSCVTYSFSAGKLFRSVRINKDALKIDAQIRLRLLAQNIKQMWFTYLLFDPEAKILHESDTWNDPAVLPTAVRVSFILEKKDNFTFKRTIYLPLGK